MNCDKIPERTMQGMMRYIEEGIPTGGFLHAVFANDLFESVGRADEENLAALTQIVTWIYNEAPSACHGSYDKVSKWLRGGEDIEAIQKSWKTHHFRKRST